MWFKFLLGVFIAFSSLVVVCNLIVFIFYYDHFTSAKLLQWIQYNVVHLKFGVLFIVIIFTFQIIIYRFLHIKYMKSSAS